MIIGHIGARKGSKGVPGKNFRDVCGKPLIDWSLDQLFQCERVDVVVVSTDSEEMYEHAIARGTLDIGLRPAHLANDTAAKWNVWEHALEEVEKQTGPASVFMDLDCTSPLREAQDIENALDLFFAEQPDMVMTCAEARTNPYFNLLETDETGALHVSKPLPNGVVARQQAPMVYQHAASTYIMAADYIKRANALFEGRVLPSVVPASRSQDIDEEIDFQVVKFLMEERLKQQSAS
ncbi:acylneuraminate cytidylyltransferase family protein [Cochlodiniinecator piscidefendens]|uniref:acylneuraminate cytidylyltransferase family protein n=1 Tax=Cochlodiniinecator piscidefendens TaxID=2715756 RepID=UPI00140BD910|nr:acylneuraminate cytidylyltransferase family protein [Cochlodiniinecator piscidefendens]